MFCIDCGARIPGPKYVCVKCPSNGESIYLAVDDDEARIEIHETKETIGSNINFYYRVAKGRKLIIDPDKVFNDNSISHIYELLSSIGLTEIPTGR